MTKYLSKEQYDYRRESAAVRNMDNIHKAMSSGMSEEVAEQIYALCSIRHAFHSEIKRIAANSEYDLRIVDRLSALAFQLAEEFRGKLDVDSLRKAVSLIERTDYMNLIEEYADDMPDHDDEEAYANWYDRNLHAAMDNLEEANTCIERFLGVIDKVYGSNFRPTGALRV